MAETTPHPDADRETPPRMPRWVKAAAIIAGVLILVFVVVKLTGLGGEHGPGRHMSGAPASNTLHLAAPSSPLVA